MKMKGYKSAKYVFSNEEIEETYRNSEELKTGKVKGLSLEEVLKYVRARLEERRKSASS